MADIRIVAQCASAGALNAARAAIQQVPLAWEPLIGSENDDPPGAWDDGTSVRTSQGILVPNAKKWGVRSEDFYVGTPPEGVNDPPEGNEWNESQAIAALGAIPDVTVTVE